ncbi:Bgt-20517 [Blumeria graminis f. sp. tritici]|uniref:Bgt-20517 n=2 Tax=Blumeria graminis f. sp. tritici TaxID=62690 RepID=A0A9X9LBF7_BLUGR|nr:Bgt-20517 [Blumeria graminis f. sp. tritici]
MKFIANSDWHPNEQCKMLYLISRLRGKAYSTISQGINRDGTFKFTSCESILLLLEQAFADMDECDAARSTILKIKQGQKDTSTHISD